MVVPAVVVEIKDGFCPFYVTQSVHLPFHGTREIIFHRQLSSDTRCAGIYSYYNNLCHTGLQLVSAVHGKG